MSAIFGIIRLDGGTVEARDLERMANVLAHRGPDGRKFALNGPAGLGHCLMRVNREDAFEAQPLRDAGLICVADLRLDNREELGGLFGIGGGALRDMPDSALVMHAYRKWGEDCAGHLLGDFAFAIWDARASKLVLGRDHMGQRSVHYHLGAKFLVFATEIKALWALPDVPRKISEAQLGKFLLKDRSSQFAADVNRRPTATFFEDIYGVPSGATAVLPGNRNLAIRRYWEPHAAPQHHGRDENYYVECYRSIFAEAVDCRIRRLIGPPALLLSGGYDSTAIAGLSGPVLSAQRRKMLALSAVRPEDHCGLLPGNRHWVELCRRDMPHLDIRYFVRDGETFFSRLEQDYLAADGPPSMGSYRLDAFFRYAASAGARLIMDGNGGDNTLNPLGGGALAYFLRTGQFKRFLSEFGPHLRLSGHSLWQTLRYDIAAELTPMWLRELVWAARRGFAPAWSETPITPAFAADLMKNGDVGATHILATDWRRTRMRTVNLQSLLIWIGRYRRLDANEAAARGLDLTRPLIDKRVVEFSLAVPEELYVKNGRNRYLACRALADVYPAEFQTRGRRRDSFEPDLPGVVQASHAQIMQDIDRLAGDPTLRKYFDFERLKGDLTLCGNAQMVNSSVALAIRTILAARYVAWFAGGNEPAVQGGRLQRSKTGC